MSWCSSDVGQSDVGQTVRSQVCMEHTAERVGSQQIVLKTPENELVLGACPIIPVALCLH